MDKPKSLDSSFTYKDLPNVSETYADGVYLVSLDRGTLKIVFTASRADPPRPPKITGQKVTALRLVMPMSGLVELYNEIHRLMTGLEQQGMIQRDGPKVSTTMQ